MVKTTGYSERMEKGYLKQLQMETHYMPDIAEEISHIQQIYTQQEIVYQLVELMERSQQSMQYISCM